MAEVVNDINPKGRGAGYDYVFNPNQILGALQTRIGLDARQAVMEGARRFREQQLRQRAEEQAAKMISGDLGVGGLWSDYHGKDVSQFRDAALQSFQDKSPNIPALSMGSANVKTQGKIYDEATKRVLAGTAAFKAKPYVNKENVDQSVAQSLIRHTDEVYKNKKPGQLIIPPDEKVLADIATDANNINPAALGAYVIKNLTGQTLYTFKGPDHTGETITRDKIFDKDGKISLDVVKDMFGPDANGHVVNSDLNTAYTALYGKNLKEQQSLGLIGEQPDEMQKKAVAHQTLSEIFPAMLGDYKRVLDMEKPVPRQPRASKKDTEVSITDIPVKISIMGRAGSTIGAEHKSNLISLKKAQAIPEGTKVVSYDNKPYEETVEETVNGVTKEKKVLKEGAGEQSLPSGFEYKEAVPTVVFRAKQDLRDPRGNVIIKKGDMIDPKASKGGVMDRRLYDVEYGYKVTPETTQSITDASGNVIQRAPKVSAKTFFIKKGGLPKADDALTEFLRENKINEGEYFNKIRKQLLGGTTANILGLQ